MSSRATFSFTFHKQFQAICHSHDAQISKRTLAREKLSRNCKIVSCLRITLCSSLNIRISVIYKTMKGLVIVYCKLLPTSDSSICKKQYEMFVKARYNVFTSLLKSVTFRVPYRSYFWRSQQWMGRNRIRSKIRRILWHTT